MMALLEIIKHFLTDQVNPESLTKRLKLAKNVLNQPDLLIGRKEDFIFRWLWEEVSSNNTPQIWNTIYDCMISVAKPFTKLSLETKNIIYDQLTIIFEEWPKEDIPKEVLQCCTYIFINIEFESYISNKKFSGLFGSMTKFTSEVLCSEKTDSVFYDLCLECVTNAVTKFSQLCKQNYKNKHEAKSFFINEILFPLSGIVQSGKLLANSKLAIETQKCIRNLLYVNNQLLIL